MTVSSKAHDAQEQGEYEELVISVAVGVASDFVPGRMRIVALIGDAVLPADREIGVLQAQDGGWHAVRNLCPHRAGAVCRGRIRGTMLPASPGALDYALDGKVLVCPWHQHEFDIESGACLFIDDHSSLVKYPVEVIDGEVRIQITALGPASGDVTVERLPEFAQPDPAGQGVDSGAFE
jgi:nitrite reductase/ring-hydroxylating ferredoxin subunit